MDGRLDGCEVPLDVLKPSTEHIGNLEGALALDERLRISHRFTATEATLEHDHEALGRPDFVVDVDLKLHAGILDDVVEPLKCR